MYELNVPRQCGLVCVVNRLSKDQFSCFIAAVARGRKWLDSAIFGCLASESIC